MAVTILEKPYKIAFSRNPINYTLTTDSPLNTEGLAVEVKLLYRPFRSGAVYDTVIIFPLTPDSTGKVSIDFKKILDSKVEFQLPSFELVAQGANGQLGEYYIAFREISAGNADPVWEEEPLRHAVIKGGLPYERWQGPNFFKNFDFAEKNWLTWQPSGRSCAPWEKMWLTYFHLKDDDDRYKIIRIKIYYTDGTSDDTKTLPVAIQTFYKYSVLRIPTGIEQLGLQLLQVSKKIQYYEFQIVHPDGAVMNPISPVYVYTVDYTPDYQQQQFNYFNSLGALDSVRVTGEINKVPQYGRDLAESNPSPNYHLSENLVPMKFTQQVLEEVAFKGTLGWIDDMQEQDLYRDFLLSKSVHQVKYKRWWPVNLTTPSADMGPLVASLRTIDIEWTYGFTNESYAPEWAQLASLADLCPIVTNVRNTVIADYANQVEWDGDEDDVSYIVLQTITAANGSKIFNNFYPTGKQQIIPVCYLPSTVQVKTVCESSQSPFTAAFELPQQQIASCPNPIDVSFNYGPAFRSYILSWTGDPSAIKYEIRQRTPIAGGGNDYATFETAGSSIQISKPNIFVHVYVQVRAICAGGDVSPYTAEIFIA